MRVHCVGLIMLAMIGPVQAWPELNRYGKEIEKKVTLRYQAYVESCPNNRPAYECSGLLIRGVGDPRGKHFNAWDPPRKGATHDTSFSYVRIGISFERLAFAYTNGYIVSPPGQEQPGQLKLQPTCVYPVDGASDKRSDKGCGAYEDKKDSSAPCVVSSDIVKDAQAWFEAHSPIEDKAYDTRCAFSLKGPNVTEAFMTALAVVERASEKTTVPNDFKVTSWTAETAAALPVEAFFYNVKDRAIGLPIAQFNQCRFNRVTGRKVPILRRMILQVNLEPFEDRIEKVNPLLAEVYPALKNMAFEHGTLRAAVKSIAPRAEGLTAYNSFSYYSEDQVDDQRCSEVLSAAAG